MAAADRPDDDEIFNYPGGKARSNVWKIFGFRKKCQGPPTRENLDMATAICWVCRKEYKNKGNTTNLQFHINHDHATGATINAQPKTTQLKLDWSFTGQPLRLSSNRQSGINEALMKLPVAKVLPLSLVDNKEFRSFVALLDPRYEVPSRKAITTQLQKKKEEIQKKIETDIARSPDVAITRDSWTSMNTESFNTVTGHFITPEWELKSVVLETMKSKGRHTSENIASSLKETEKRWKLKEPIAVTDNAANEKKAFEILEWVRFGCYGHIINLVVKKSLEVSEVSRLIGKGRTLVTFFHQSSSAFDALKVKQKLLLSSELVGHKLIADVPTRWNSTHAMLSRLVEQTPAIMALANDCSLSNTAKNTIKACVFSFEEHSLAERLINILEPFEKATTIVSAEKNPTLQKIMPILVKIDKCMKPSEDDPEVIRKVKVVIRQQMASRTTGDRKLVSMACVLNPFAKDLEFLSTEDREYAHDLLLRQAGGVKVVVKSEPTDENDNVEVPRLPALPSLEEVQEDIQKQVISLEEEEDTATPGTPPPAKREEDTATPGTPPPAERVCPVTPAADVDAWLEDVMCIGETQKPREDVVFQEVARYLGSAHEDRQLTLLQWWKKNSQYFPRVSLLARKYLAVPASSVPSERVFSLAGNLVNKKRARLSPANIDLIVFLRKNMEFYW